MSTFFSPVARHKPLGSGDEAVPRARRKEMAVWAAVLLASGTVFVGAAFSISGSNASSTRDTPVTTLAPDSIPPSSVAPPVDETTTSSTTAAPETTTTTAPPQTTATTAAPRTTRPTSAPPATQTPATTTTTQPTTTQAPQTTTTLPVGQEGKQPRPTAPTTTPSTTPLVNLGVNINE
jgi:hypothetical protein